MTDTKSYTVKIKNLPQSEVEIKGSISAETFDGYRTSAIQKLGANITLPGFRKGKAPIAMLADRIGEASILEEMAEMALNTAYLNMIEENTIDAIGHPKIQITKIGAGNPLEFTLTTAVMPHIQLGDYKKIAQKENAQKIEITVEEKEIENIIAEVKKRKALETQVPQNIPPNETVEQKIDDQKIQTEESIELPLPELTDDDIKTLGDFKNVADFKSKLSENIRKEKEMQSVSEKREKIVKTIVESSTIELPALLIENETKRIEHQFTHDLAHANITFEEYLKETKKTEEELRKQWNKTAEDTLKTQFVFEELIKKENISVSEKEREEEVSRLLKRYPQADRVQLQSYIDNNLLTQKVFEFLESQK
ncbi:MAG: trigger factor [bacterium]